MSDKKHALSLLADAARFAPQCNFDRAGQVLNAQLALIRAADPLISKRAIFVGTALLMVKESLAHGEFGPWLDKNIDDLGRRQVAYYMKLALAALDHTKVDQKALAALPVGEIETALTVSKGPAAEFRQAVERFVGDSSLADLLAEHCGKKKGAPKKSAGSDDQDDAGEAEQEVTVQDRFNEIETSLRAAVRGATDKGTWMAFDRKQHDALKALFTDAANDLDAIYLKTHGRNARK